jgi:hypothetical protein
MLGNLTVCARPESARSTSFTSAARSPSGAERGHDVYAHEGSAAAGRRSFGMFAESAGDDPCAAVAAARRLSALSTAAKGNLGRAYAQAEIARRNWTVVAEEAYVRVTRQYVDEAGDLVTRTYKPRVDFVARTDDGVLVGVEAKFGPRAALSEAQENGYRLINGGARNALFGRSASAAWLYDESLQGVHVMDWFADRFGAAGVSLCESIGNAMGANLAIQAGMHASESYASGQPGGPRAAAYQK